MITDNTKGPQTGSKTFEEWIQSEGSLYANLPEPKLREAYEKWLKDLGSSKDGSTLTNPQFTDNTLETQTTEMLEKKPTSNIDLLGTTDVLAQVGIATDNSTITKAGLLGNSTVKAVLQIKNAKGLTGIAKTGAITGAVGGVADSVDQMFFGDLAAKNSDLTNGMNSAYDQISSGIMTMGPYGAMIGGAMKIGGLLSDGLTALGVGTDQMTTTDKILDSKFMKLTPMGLVNGIGAKSSDKFAVDNNVRSQIGSSYGGAYKFMDDAASKAGKKYGLFSSGALADANRQIGQAKKMQSKIGNINKDALDRKSIVNSSSDLLSTNYQFNLAGGYDQRYIRAAKEGSKIDRIKKINLTLKKGGQIHNIINLETKEVEWQPVYLPIEEDDWEPVLTLKTGGVIEDEWQPIYEEVDDWEPEIQVLKEGNKVKKTDKKYKSFKDFIEYLGERGKSDDYDYEGFYNDNDSYQDWEEEELKSPGKAHFIDKYKLPNHITFSTQSKYSNAFTKGGEWIEDDNGITYVTSPYVEKLHSLEEMIRYFRKNEPGVNLVYNGMMIPAVTSKPFMKDGGKTEESAEEPLSNQQNVIPEGALHARKHHMENADDLTKKGIPVIDNKGEQLAEIELNEIIFNLEVTKKLEELYEDGSDEAAIEAGKLLVQEILFNTEDRTGLINTLKLGGTINE